MNYKRIIGIIIEKILTKATIVLIVASIIFHVFFTKKSIAFAASISNLIMTDANLSAIITISSVFIGFFATIMTMFASSQTESMNRLISTNKIDHFIIYAKIALFSSISVMIISLLNGVFSSNSIYIYFYMCLLFFFLMASLRFSFICIIMLGYSIDEIKNQQHKKEEERILLLKKRKGNE